MRSKFFAGIRFGLIFCLGSFHFSAVAITCTPYSKTSEIISAATGKQVMKAFELYNADDINGAISILKQTPTSNTYDKAYVNRFLGNMYAGQDTPNAANTALKYLVQTVNSRVLATEEHVGSIKLVADLSLQQKEYETAIKYYEQYNRETCTSTPDVLLRMSQSYYELKKYPRSAYYAKQLIAIDGLSDNVFRNAHILALSNAYEQKYYDQARKYVQILNKKFPQDKRWAKQLVQFSLLVDDHAGAKDDFLSGVKDGSITLETAQDVQIFKLGAQLFVNDKQYDSAFYILSTMVPFVEDKKKHIEQILNIAWYLKPSDLDKIEAIAVKHLPEGEHWWVYGTLGNIAAYIGDTDRTIKLLNYAITFEKVENEFHPRYELAFAYMDKGNINAALAHIEVAKKVKDKTEEEAKKLMALIKLVEAN